jgi:hypothetical protein
MRHRSCTISPMGLLWPGRERRSVPVAFWRTPPAGLRQQGRRFAPLLFRGLKPAAFTPFDSPAAPTRSGQAQSCCAGLMLADGVVLKARRGKARSPSTSSGEAIRFAQNDWREQWILGRKRVVLCTTPTSQHQGCGAPGALVWLGATLGQARYIRAVIWRRTSSKPGSPFNRAKVWSVEMLRTM